MQLLQLLKSKINHVVIGTSLLFVSCLTVRQAYCRIYRKMKKLPYGPNGIPFFGALIYAIIQKERFSTWCANKYSKYITFHWFGSVAYATIHDYQLAKEIFSNPNCQNRNPLIIEMVANESDIARIPYSSQWKERRKLVRSTLLTLEDSNYVDFNVNLFIQKYIDTEIYEKSKKNGCWNCKDLEKSIRHLSFSMIIKVMFGKEFKSNDTKYIELDYLYEEFTKSALDAFLKAAIIGNSESAMNNIRHFEEKLDTIIENDFVKPSINNYDEINKTTYFDFAYSYINNKQLNKNNITLTQLMMDFRILIQASIDTLSFVIEMALLNLIKYTEIQQDIYNELKGEYYDGENNKIEIKRITKCPKFRAYIHEILRTASPIPSGVPRYVTKDIKIMNGRYILPKGTTVTMNLQYINYENIEKWGKNGKEINLDHWLDDESSKYRFKNRNDVFPFSVGMRDCVGRSLALRLLYCILANMILKYKFMKHGNDEFKIKTIYLATAGQRLDMNCKIIAQKRENNA